MNHQQGSLFGGTESYGETIIKPLIKPLSPTEADAAKDAGIARAAEHAEADSPGFVERAKTCVLAFLQANGPTSSEALTDACLRAGIVPDELRAFGQVYASLSREKAIKIVGACRRMRGHSSAGGNVWDLTTQGN